jgi:hypothetical protein
MEPQYGIRLIPGVDGQLLWKLGGSPAGSVSTPPRRLTAALADKKPSHFSQRVFYDDGRCRRIIYEVDGGLFRYVLERSKDDQNGGGIQRLVFPTLRAALFCLVGCINRSE